MNSPRLPDGRGRSPRSCCATCCCRSRRSCPGWARTRSTTSPSMPRHGATRAGACPRNASIRMKGTAAPGSIGRPWTAYATPWRGAAGKHAARGSPRGRLSCQGTACRPLTTLLSSCWRTVRLTTSSAIFTRTVSPPGNSLQASWATTSRTQMRTVILFLYRSEPIFINPIPIRVKNSITLPSSCSRPLSLQAFPQCRASSKTTSIL